MNMQKTPEEIKADKEYKDKKNSLSAFKEKHKNRKDGLKDMALDIEKRGINHENGLKGEIQDKLKILKDLEQSREIKGKYSAIIEELEKELL
jgi:hypothetical protein